jgi:hypothetical protein
MTVSLILLSLSSIDDCREIPHQVSLADRSHFLGAPEMIHRAV